MHLLKRVVAAAFAKDGAPDGAEQPALSEGGVTLDVEQRLTRVEVEVGDLWEAIKRMSARAAARARRDVERIEAQDEPTLAPQPATKPSAAPVGLIPGSKAWRDYQKSLIRHQEEVG